MIPKLSIIIPTYKRADLLDRLLESICAQTESSYEVIVVDDHSPNQVDYQSLIDKYQKRISNFSYYSNDRNCGAPYCRNFGLKRAQADLVSFVDDDDTWLPHKIEKQLPLFEQSNIGLVYSFAYIFNQEEQSIGAYAQAYAGDLRSHILEGCFIPSPTIMVRKSLLLEVDGFDEKLQSCQDWDLWTRLIFLPTDVAVVTEYLARYYKHDRPTIGSSPKAKAGYRRYYFKHFFKLIRYQKWRALIRALRFWIRWTD